MRSLPDSELIALVERAKAALIERLNSDCPSVQLANIASISQHVEHILLEELSSNLLVNAETLFGLRASVDKIHLLDRRGCLYRAFCACDVMAPNRLVVHLLAVSESRGKRRELLIEVGGTGQYREIVLAYPSRLAFTMRYPLIRYWFRSLVEAGYWWYFEQAKRVGNELLSDLASRLYGYARQFLCGSDLCDSLWFSAIWEGVGFRLLNDKVVQKAFSSIKEHNKTDIHSTNRYIAELLATQLPERMMLMRTAIDGGVCVDVDITDAVYRKNGSIYALTMATLYGSQSFSVYPIYRSDRLSVGSVFPTHLRHELQPTLDVHCNELAKVCEGYAEPRRTGGRMAALRPVYEGVMLQPNLFGIGVDLKVLFEWLRGRGISRDAKD